MFDVITQCKKKKMHALFCLYYVVIYEFKYETKMIKPSRLVLAGRDIESLRSQNTQFRDRFRQTCYKYLVFARGEFLSVVCHDPLARVVTALSSLFHT